jgi:hypothetical protein
MAGELRGEPLDEATEDQPVKGPAVEKNEGGAVADAAYGEGPAGDVESTRRNGEEVVGAHVE